MCGLFGFYVKSRVGKSARDRLLAGLAFANASRGDQAWGISTGHGNSSRALGSTHDSMGALMLASGASRIVMGHTRWPTQGENSIENAHPFLGSRLTLAHNGQIWNAPNHGVDSLAILEKMEKGERLEGLHGYGAITWFVAGDKNLHLARLSSTGNLAIRKGAWGTAYSSDDDHLKMALALAGLDRGKLLEVKEGNSAFIDSTGCWVDHQGDDYLVGSYTWSQSQANKEFRFEMPEESTDIPVDLMRYEMMEMYNLPEGSLDGVSDADIIKDYEENFGESRFFASKGDEEGAAE